MGFGVGWSCQWRDRGVEEARIKIPQGEVRQPIRRPG